MTLDGKWQDCLGIRYSSIRCQGCGVMESYGKQSVGFGSARFLSGDDRKIEGSMPRIEGEKTRIRGVAFSVRGDGPRSHEASGETAEGNSSSDRCDFSDRVITLANGSTNRGQPLFAFVDHA